MPSHKKTLTQPGSQPKGKVALPVNWLNLLIVCGYAFVTVVTPNLDTFDSNGPKFLALALWNVAVLLYFLFLELRNKNTIDFLDFFKTKVGLAYSLLILISLVSFVKSINVSESIFHFSKVFTVFTAAIVIAGIVRKDKSILIYLIVGLTGLLIFDSIRVFLGTYDFIKGDLKDLLLLKAGYSNKNILAAALFVKLPFAIWLLTFQTGWLKKFGIVGLFFGLVSILIMSTRAFYLGLIFVSFFYVVFLIIRFYQEKDRNYLKILATYLVSLTLAFLVFTIVQRYFYPKVESLYNEDFAGRLSTISAEEGGGYRLISWGMTLELVKKNPLLGVGLGNWKVAILEYENPTKGDFTYHFKTHNDFLEILAEVGAIGLICFASIFAVCFFGLLNYLRGDRTIERTDLLFLCTFGLLAYSFDAFFNFPQDRPEIQSLFVIYVGVTIAIFPIWLGKKDSVQQNENSSSSVNEVSSKAVLGILFAIMIFSTLLLFWNFRSFQVQRILKQEEIFKETLVDSDYLIENFPSIPNLSAVGDPINTLIAKKLNDENKYEKALEFLRKANPSPFDTRREFYMAFSYYKLNDFDSAMYFMKQAYAYKPLNLLYAKLYINILENLGKEKEAIELLDNFLAKNKLEKEAWLLNVSLNNKLGDKDRVIQLLDSAVHYLPTDSAIVKQKEYYTYTYFIPNYAEAFAKYNEGNFKEAVKFFELSESDFLEYGNPEQVPNFLNSWATSHLESNQVSEAKRLFERVAKTYPKDYFSLKNLGFIAFQYDKNYAAAINYYSQSLEADSPDYFQSYMNLGTIYLIQGQKDLAISNYESSLKHGSSEMVIKNLFLLWTEKGNAEKIQYYKSLLAKS